MFNGIPQGAPQIAQGTALQILRRKDMTLIPATVTNVSAPHIPKAAQSNPTLAWQGLVVDLTISMGNETTTVEYPMGSVSANYPDKGWFISTDAATLGREIEAIDNKAKQDIANEPWNHMVVEKCPQLYMQIFPEKAKEAQQAQEIEMLKQQIAEMRSRSSESDAKLDRILESLSAGRPMNNKRKED